MGAGIDAEGQGNERVECSAAGDIEEPGASDADLPGGDVRKDERAGAAEVIGADVGGVVAHAEDGSTDNEMAATGLRDDAAAAGPAQAGVADGFESGGEAAAWDREGGGEAEDSGIAVVDDQRGEGDGRAGVIVGDEGAEAAAGAEGIDGVAVGGDAGGGPVGGIVPGTAQAEGAAGPGLCSGASGLGNEANGDAKQ